LYWLPRRLKSTTVERVLSLRPSPCPSTLSISPTRSATSFCGTCSRPFRSAGGPSEAVDYSQGNRIHPLGLAHSFLGADDRRPGITDPFLGADGPLRGGPQFFLGTGRRRPGTGEPFLGTDDLSLGPDESFLGTDEPFLGMDESFLGTNELFRGTNDVFLGTDDPFHGENASQFYQIRCLDGRTGRRIS
jgi:hypothetical protein